MKVNNCELIEKWGFWLTVYAFVSVFLTIPLLTYPFVLSSRLIALGILSPCLVGGIFFLYFGTKFRSGIYLSAGASMLLSLTFLWSSTYYQAIEVLLILIVSFCLLVARCAKTGFLQNLVIEKWGNRLTGFLLCLPLFAFCLYLYARTAPDRPWELFPYTKLMWLAVPCALAGLLYLFLGAKHRSYKYANMGLATLYLTYFNLIFVGTLVLRFID
jgi:hypothetical protein